MPKRVLSDIEIHTELTNIATALDAFEGGTVRGETARQSARMALTMIALALLSLHMKSQGEIPDD